MLMLAPSRLQDSCFDYCLGFIHAGGQKENLACLLESCPPHRNLSTKQGEPWRR